MFMQNKIYVPNIKNKENRGIQILHTQLVLNSNDCHV
jgi:hypothetical protein